MKKILGIPRGGGEDAIFVCGEKHYFEKGVRNDFLKNIYTLVKEVKTAQAFDRTGKIIASFCPYPPKIKLV